jgi:hypothetical protein
MVRQITDDAVRRGRDQEPEEEGELVCRLAQTGADRWHGTTPDGRRVAIRRISDGSPEIRHLTEGAGEGEAGDNVFGQIDALRRGWRRVRCTTNRLPRRSSRTGCAPGRNTTTSSGRRSHEQDKDLADAGVAAIGRAAPVAVAGRAWARRPFFGAAGTGIDFKRRWRTKRVGGPGEGRRNRFRPSGGHGARRRRETKGAGTMSSVNEALSDYQRYRARQGEPEKPPPAAEMPAPGGGHGAPDPAAAHQAALDHSVKLLTPSYRAEWQQRAAAAAAERQAALPPPPPPRDVLREAHQARADATAEVERLQTAVERARAHLAEVTEARDAARRDLEAIETAHTAQLIDELANGQAGRIEPATGAERVALAAAEHEVTIAQRAADKLAGDVTEVETRLSTAKARVEAAICAVLLAEAQRQAEAILVK